LRDSVVGGPHAARELQGHEDPIVLPPMTVISMHRD
jgi:hypothetical protein